MRSQWRCSILAPRKSGKIYINRMEGGLPHQGRVTSATDQMTERYRYCPSQAIFFSRILLKRITDITVDPLLRDQQAGFRKTDIAQTISQHCALSWSSHWSGIGHILGKPAAVASNTTSPQWNPQGMRNSGLASRPTCRCKEDGPHL